TGTDLMKRIEVIMTNRLTVKLNFAKKAALAVAGLAALAFPIVIGITHTSSVRAQSPAIPKFEVASIRPCGGGDFVSSDTKSKQPGGRIAASPGRLDLRCAAL